MLDDFREQASFEEPEDEAQNAAATYQPAQPQGRFLGMTPFQRFFIAFMLLALTTLFSALCLLVTQKIVLPFVH